MKEHSISKISKYAENSCVCRVLSNAHIDIGI